MDDYGKKPNPGHEGGGAGDDPHRPSWPTRPQASSAGRSYENPWSQPASPEAQRPGAPPPRPRPSRPPGGQVTVSERKARLTLTLFAASFGVLIVGLVVFFTVQRLRNGDDPVTGTGKTTAEDAARAVGGIGPPPGVELGPYIETRKAALDQLDDERVAVVSLTGYSTEASARSVAGTAEVLGLLAAAPGGQPSVVDGSVSAWVDSQTADARAERDEIQRLIPTVRSEPEFQAFYRSELERLDALISRIQPGGELVFGLVVRGPATVLRELGNKAEVRLVDVGPGADPGPKPVYRGIRPEETAKANDPNTRPV